MVATAAVVVRQSRLRTRRRWRRSRWRQQAGTAPLTVQLDASTSTDTGGSIASYAWNFGDNSAAGSGVTTSHVFQATGTYTVTLTVTDNGGATGATTRQVSVGQVPTVSKIAAIDVGDMTACAVGVDGKAWCWGPNDYGQLGTGDVAQGNLPRRTAEGYAFNKISVSTGGAFACGITLAGQAYCWGSQEGGRLGDGTVHRPGSTSPHRCRSRRSHVLRYRSRRRPCLRNRRRRCRVLLGPQRAWPTGHWRFANSSVPVAVSGGLSFTSITTHQMVTCGVTERIGSGYCWGDGDRAIWAVARGLAATYLRQSRAGSASHRCNSGCGRPAA